MRNLADLLQTIGGNVESLATKYAIQLGLFRSQIVCPYHTSHQLELQTPPLSTRLGFRCTRNKCHLSHRTTSILHKMRLSAYKALQILFLWSQNTRLAEICYKLHVSRPTAQKLCDRIRRACTWKIDYNSTNKMGGLGYTVEIDESMLFSRHQRRGRRMQSSVWVFGAVCRETGDLFLQIVTDRTKETLIPIIRQHIELGTTIISDCWKPYRCLKQQGYRHLTVNHSKTFLNRASGAHTNTIEGVWRWLKHSLPTSGIKKSRIDAYIKSFQWQRIYGRRLNSFITVVDHVRQFYER